MVWNLITIHLIPIQRKHRATISYFYGECNNSLTFKIKLPVCNCGQSSEIVSLVVSVGLKKAPHSAPFCSLSLPGEGKENAAHLHNLQIGFAQNMTPLLLLYSLSCSYSWAVQIKRQTPSQPAIGIETHANGMQCSRRRRRPGGGKERSTRD